MHFVNIISALSLLVVLVSTPVSAGTIVKTFSGPFSANVTGTLPDQGTALLEQFNLPAMGSVTIATTSYASGGFQPNVFLYDAAGKFVSAGGPSGVADPGTGLIGDSSLTEANLPSGMYTVAITDFLLNQSITATNLSDGFTANYGSGGANFTDAGGNSRNGNYAFTISYTSAVPEPATLALAAPLLIVAALALARRRAQ